MLYANTDDGSSALWVCDGNGIVVDNISIYGAERAPILEQINEHYGTSFTGWSDNEIGLRFGDPIPDWNSYEKILLSLAEGLYKFDVSEGANAVFAAMNFQNGTMSIYSSVKDTILKINIYNPQGNFIGADGNENIVSAISEICSKYSNVQTVEKVDIGTNNLENFGNFSVIS